VVINFSEGGQMLFGHMSKVASNAGDTVKQGDVIGYVGSTGLSTGNHIHVSARAGLKNPYAGLKVGNTSKDY
jgi:murein DD-endopeptidase MepM/ murein hydrolase activator NlpD